MKSYRPLHPTIIVRLSSTILEQEIIQAKKRFNYITVKDIRAELLEPGIVLPGPGCNIFINEALSSIEFNNFLALKQVAKHDGFEYVWHSVGKFLARWKDRSSTHIITFVADLRSILKLYRAPARERILMDTTFSPHLKKVPHLKST